MAPSFGLFLPLSHATCARREIAEALHERYRSKLLTAVCVVKEIGRIQREISERRKRFSPQVNTCFIGSGIQLLEFTFKVYARIDC
jgi:hypothetical protein